MLRRALVAAVVVAMAATASAANRPAPDLSGKWLLTYSPPGAEANYCVITIETKDGKTTATAAGPKGNMPVTGIEVGDKELTIKLGVPSFSGVIGTDAKTIKGSMGTDTVLYRAKLTRTDADTPPPAGKVNVPEAMTKAQSLTTRPLILRSQAQQEKDADKKKDLLAQADAARKEADEKIPGLYREVIEKNPNDPAALDAAAALLQLGTKANVTAAEARKLVKVIDTQAAPYGPRFVQFNQVRVGRALASQKELAPVAVEVLKPAIEKLSDKDPVAAQVSMLSTYKMALENAGNTTELKAIDARLAKLETKLDAEYMATVPPFKPTPYAGRKEKGANKVAMMELFTGAQCPPCVAADAAFDGLVKAYKPTDLVLVQYHTHIPGPDPMTNPDTLARWDYYRGKFPAEIRGVPSSVFGGKPAAGGGGGMPQAEGKFNQYCKVIDPILEETTPVKLAGKATRSGDQIRFAIEVNGAEAADDLKLRVLVVEPTVKFVGGNGIRFHHNVVRSMPGGAAGVAIKDKMKHEGTADVGTIRKSLTKYLDDFAANERPFPQPGRPLDMKDLAVIAFVQNDKTGEIVQAIQIEVEGRAAGGR